MKKLPPVMLKVSLLLGLLLFISFTPSGFAQNGGSDDLPAPTIDAIIASSPTEAEDAVSAVTFSAKIPNEEGCECGAIFELKRAGENEWVLLGIISPEEVGDERPKTEWTYTINYLEIGVEYNMRAKIFGRQHQESAYTTKDFTVAPQADVPCTEGTFSDIEKISNTAPIILMLWEKVCKNTVEANRYKVFKNNQLVRETDNGATNIAVPGTPAGDLWRIEAYGEGASEPGVIRSCGEVVSKMNERLGSVPRPANLGGGFYLPGATISRTIECEKIGDWVRALIEWTPYNYCAGYTGSSCPPYDYRNLRPEHWMQYSVTGGPALTFNSTYNYPRNPFQFNYVEPHTSQQKSEWKGYVQCHNVNISDHSIGTNTDPWGQVNWTCPGNVANGPLVNGPYGPNTVQTVIYRMWVNFDTTVGGSSGSAWPVTTEFTY